MLSCLFVISSYVLLAQDPPPPPPSGGHGQSGNSPAGGGAPVGEGVLLLSFLGLGYGIRKWKENKNDRQHKETVIPTELY